MRPLGTLCLPFLDVLAWISPNEQRAPRRLMVMLLMHERAALMDLWTMTLPVCVQLVSWYDNEWGYSNRVRLHSPN